MGQKITLKLAGTDNIATQKGQSVAKKPDNGVITTPKKLSSTGEQNIKLAESQPSIYGLLEAGNFNLEDLNETYNRIKNKFFSKPGGLSAKNKFAQEIYKVYSCAHKNSDNRNSTEVKKLLTTLLKIFIEIRELPKKPKKDFEPVVNLFRRNLSDWQKHFDQDTIKKDIFINRLVESISFEAFKSTSDSMKKGKTEHLKKMLKSKNLNNFKSNLLNLIHLHAYRTHDTSAYSGQIESIKNLLDFLEEKSNIFTDNFVLIKDKKFHETLLKAAENIRKYLEESPASSRDKLIFLQKDNLDDLINPETISQQIRKEVILDKAQKINPDKERGPKEKPFDIRTVAPEFYKLDDQETDEIDLYEL